MAQMGKRGFRVLALTLVVWFGAGIALAQESRMLEEKKDEETYSCIQVVDVSIFLSEDMTISQTRKGAFSEAKRQALENAKTYVRSHTKVEDYVVSYDVVWADAEGAVKILEAKDHGVENNSKYHVWIKAEVEYDLTPKPRPAPAMAAAPAQPGAAPQASPHYAQSVAPASVAVAPLPKPLPQGGPLTVRVWTDKKTYRQGEVMSIFVMGNRDFYARVINISPSGQVIQLLPNAYRNIARFEANKTYRIPDGADRFQLMVGPPFGTEQISVYASETPLSDPGTGMQAAGAGLYAYQGSKKDLGQALTRSITVVPQSQWGQNLAPSPSPAQPRPMPQATGGNMFYSATWNVTTTP